jgi:hypothetical protein
MRQLQQGLCCKKSARRGPHEAGASRSISWTYAKNSNKKRKIKPWCSQGVGVPRDGLPSKTHSDRKYPYIVYNFAAIEGYLVTGDLMSATTAYFCLFLGCLAKPTSLDLLSKPDCDAYCLTLQPDGGGNRPAVLLNGCGQCSGDSDASVKVEVSSGSFKIKSREYFTTSKRIQEITAPFVYVAKLTEREMEGNLLKVPPVDRDADGATDQAAMQLPIANPIVHNLQS